VEPARRRSASVEAEEADDPVDVDEEDRGFARVLLQRINSLVRL
jgi:hypothetical protein